MANIIKEAEKATLEYRTVMGINPQDPTKRIIRPLLVNKGKYDIARCLKFAMENGYVQSGQFYANYGVVNGFLEGVQRLGKDGNDILLDGWLRIFSTVKGVCDPETRQVTDDNELHMCAQCQANLRRKASEFNWTCVDDTANRATVQHLQSVGGTNDKEIFAGAKITASGSNLTYTASSDTITASWITVDAETSAVTEHSVNLVPESSGYSNMVLPFPTGLDAAPVGTEVTFTFFLKQGNTEAVVTPAVSKATLVAAD